MTREHVRRLLDYNIQRADKTKQAVLNVVKHVGKPVSPQEITNILLANIRSRLNREYESGKISKTMLEKKIKGQSITIRTVHRKLSSLVSEGLLYNANGKYELTQKAKSDVRYFADYLGKDILSELMWMYFPGKHSIEKNADLMVRLFGVYLLYCFIETARPISHTSEKGKIYGQSKDEVISSCLQHLVRVEDMFDFFLSTLDYLLSDDNAKQSKYLKDKLYSKQSPLQNLWDYSPRKGPLSALEIDVMRKLDVREKVKPLRLALEKTLKQGEALPPADLDRFDLKGFESRRELTEDKLQKYGKALSKACSDTYPRLLKMTSVPKDNPKQKLIELRETWEPLSYES